MVYVTCNETLARGVIVGADRRFSHWHLRCFVDLCGSHGVNLCGFWLVCIRNFLSSIVRSSFFVCWRFSCLHVRFLPVGFFEFLRSPSHQSCTQSVALAAGQAPLSGVELPVSHAVVSEVGEPSPPARRKSAFQFRIWARRPQPSLLLGRVLRPSRHKPSYNHHKVGQDCCTFLCPNVPDS